MNSVASYAIDSGGTIVWTDVGFAELARSHGQPGLPATAPGRPLSDFVAGERPKRLQESLVDRARRSGAAVELEYRCDGPDMRRFAVLRIEPRDDGGVVFTTWFDSVEKRPHLPLLDYRLQRGTDVVELCAWCNRFDVGGWREAEDAVASMALTALPRVEHSVCDVCQLLLTTRPGAGPRWSGPSGPA